MTTSSPIRSGRRPLLAAAAAAALSAGILVPAATATASPAPAAASSAAVSATSRPLVPSLARVLARYRAQIAAHPGGSPAAPRTYIRPIGNGISTDLPTRISIGDDGIDVPFTVQTTTTYSGPVAFVALLDGDDNLVSYTQVFGTAGQTRFHAEFAVPISAIHVLGQGHWITGVGSATDEKAGSGAVLGTTIKIQSLLAERVTRSGDTVSVVGAARRFVGDDADGDPVFAPYVDHPVYVQRWTSRGWATLQGLHTDSLGHISTRLDIPFTVGIRLYSPDTATVFGAVTPQTVV